MKDLHSAPGTKGRVLHSAVAYDLLAWLLLRGRERAFRGRLVQLARVERAQSVLDIGCGTGSLAIATKRCVGPAGTVDGIDASPGMIARARRKAHKSRVDVTFTTGVAEALPYTDGRFDVVLSTLMLHHLPRPARALCIREAARVVKPGGRVLVVDFGSAQGKGREILAHFHRHGHIEPREIHELLGSAGLCIVESGEVGVQHLHFVMATAP